MQPDLLTALAAVPVVIWGVLLFARGGFWRVRDLGLPRLSFTSPRRVAAVIPARNEADVIARCVASLLNAASPDSFHRYLVDDDSSDGTAQAARSAAEALGKSVCLTIIPGTPPPAGWTGKLWAMEQGIARARDYHPDFLLLTDADIVHDPVSLASLVALAESRDLDVASLMVRLHCKSFAEKLMIPAFVFFFFSLYPPRWIAQTGARTAGAAGGCILIRPDALDRAGGLAAIRGEIIDDCALAAAVKRSGGKLWLGLADDTVSVRPYGSFSAIEHMIARTAFNQLGHSTVLLLLAVISLLLAFALPVALLLTGKTIPVVLGLLALAAMFVAYVPMVRFYRLTPLWAVSLPCAAVFYLGATLWSAVSYWSGAGGRWKGRVQDPSR
jgi:hopene-associated glycosyltransferase HpnB